MDDRQISKCALRARDGDEIAFERLHRQYRALIHSEARRFYAPGLTLEDFLQEGRFGLHKATVGFDPSRGASFTTIAVLAIRRQMITAVKTALRGKAGPLNYAASFESLAPDGARLEDVLPGGRDPLDVVIEREEIREIFQAVASSSPLEREAFVGLVSGYSYNESAGPHGCSRKAVDNATQRVRRKVTAALAEAA